MLAESRACTRCGLEKPLSEFSKHPRGKYGRKPSCKACDAARHAAGYVPKPRGPRRAPLGEDAVKACAKCGESKRVADFSLSRRATDTSNAVYKSVCKACASAAARRWFADNPERTAANKRRYNLEQYGITVEDYERLLQEQGGVCAICKKPETSARQGKVIQLPVDHCHATGRVRGLLCHRCNRAIGLLGDDIDLLKAAIGYLERE
ncbi:endonuclease VII domain-containing protein [Actinacidiphila sp. ITFR-21]|uniref:endonuclease VII domain-containing protein n=1 Tax=Actinacidiphila sp. ITFR-21 TaxID=3075199 RepID=UPI0028891AD5|nr:endonuclease VII domain-containing protein [Streptomyces sp. ITFR-21]WNI19174.1 endonuclease VII domain-containing protein [Streptomyces sp. ITFR-21]